MCTKKLLLTMASSLLLLGCQSPSPAVEAAPTDAPTNAPTPTLTAAPLEERSAVVVAATPAPTVTPKAPEADFTMLTWIKVVGTDGDTLELNWTKVDGATGYDVYFANGTSAYFDLYKSVSGSETKVEITGLTKGNRYKACVKAWKKNGDSASYIGNTSPVVYVIAGGYNSTHCNAKSVQVEKSSVSLKRGETFRIKASATGVKAGLMLLNLENQLRYYSSDRNVATVSASGKIRATGVGTCRIYILANNGIRTSVKVTVK